MLETCCHSGLCLCFSGNIIVISFVYQREKKLIITICPPQVRKVFCGVRSVLFVSGYLNSIAYWHLLTFCVFASNKKKWEVSPFLPNNFSSGILMGETEAISLVVFGWLSAPRTGVLASLPWMVRTFRWLLTLISLAEALTDSSHNFSCFFQFTLD